MNFFRRINAFVLVLALMIGFWTLLYYLTHKTGESTEGFADQKATLENELKETK